MKEKNRIKEKNRTKENQKYSTLDLLKKFMPYFKRYRATLIMDLFCAALTTGCELVLPLIMRYITNVGLQKGAVLTVRSIIFMGGLYMILRVIECFASFYMADAGHVMGAKIETDMREDAYNHLQMLSNTYYNNTKVGQIMGRITNDLFDVTEFAHHCPEEFFIAGIKIIISFVVLIKINVILTVVLFAMVPIMFFVCRIVNKKMKNAFREQRVQIGELNARIEDSLLGQSVVKAFTNEEIEKNKFSKDNVIFLGIKKKTYKYMAAFQTSVRLFDGLMYLIVIILGGFLVIDKKISAGDLVAYMLYVSTMIATIRRIIEFAEQFGRGMTGIERFMEIMDADIEIFDEPGAIDIESPKGDIVFNNVSFEYPDDHNRVFSKLNLSIKAGEKVAIVGPSGGGKTTLCNLIPRFFDVTKGLITLDEKNIKEYTLKSLRKAIGIVQQDVYLFSGTIKENIAYGKMGATDDEIINAAKSAGAHEFIMELKDGYDTYVGERGVKLSGGQKQRISISRVFLKNPPIIILDEATSALDNESEYLVAKSLNKLSEGRTTLTIAHRLSTIKNADRILVLTDDGIEEEGTHDDLIKLKGLYYNLYETANAMK